MRLLHLSFMVVGTSYGGYLAQGVVYRKGAQIDGMFINIPEQKVIKENLYF